MTVELILLKPETIPDIADKSGVSEENLRNLYDYDQEFSLITKIAVVRIPDPTDVINQALRDAAEKWRSWMVDGKCPTCELVNRETVNLVCQTCGHDYGRDD